MGIQNDRNKMDDVGLQRRSWSGIQQGKDGFPTKKGIDYLIHGGQDDYFKPKMIEIYGANI